MIYENENVSNIKSTLCRYFRNEQRALIAEAVEQMHNDDLIAEISDLIQSQLVTSALSGPIRETLEQQLSVR
jgi:hypothetical protein